MANWQTKTWSCFFSVLLIIGSIFSYSIVRDQQANISLSSSELSSVWGGALEGSFCYEETGCWCACWTQFCDSPLYCVILIYYGPVCPEGCDVLGLSYTHESLEDCFGTTYGENYECEQSGEHYETDCLVDVYAVTDLFCSGEPFSKDVPYLTYLCETITH